MPVERPALSCRHGHNGNLDLVELLLAHGADRTLRTDGGQNAADLARAADREEVLAWLMRS
jgi:ankyrin repeat protein